MDNNRSYRSRLFTLVEILIAMGIGLSVLAVSGTILLQIIFIYRDTSADYTLVQSSRMVRERLLGGYGKNVRGLREARDIQVNTDDGIITYKVSNSADGTLGNQNDVACRLEIEKGKKLTYAYGSKGGEMLKKDVEIVDFKVEQVMGRKKKEGESDKEYRKRVMIRLLLKMNVSGRSYYTEQFINAVIKND